MREIKFRIWNGEALEEAIIDFTVDKQTKYKELFIYPDDVLMQYTELKDKNGVEIYEGDIILYSGECNNENVKVETVYGCYGFSFKNDIQGYMLLGLYNHLCKVLGNIYENPELLEGE